MTQRVLINGFGRVGRALFRLLLDSKAQVVRINDPLPNEQLAYLLQYDSVMGRLGHDVRIDGDALLVADTRVLLSHSQRLTSHDVVGASVVVNSSGRNNTHENLSEILSFGVDRVIVSKPLAADVADKTILMGLNHSELTETDRIVSAGSCTAHCFTPVLKTLHETFGVENAYMMTVHAYTSAQNLVDGGHPTDMRRGRAGGVNIVPTTTESLVAFDQVMPDLAGKVVGMAQRVPVVNASNVELVVQLSANVAAPVINETLLNAAHNEMRGIVEYSDAPLVSSDIVGNPHSSVVDSLLTHSTPNGAGSLARVVCWYDNEWGYANRLMELLEMLP